MGPPRPQPAPSTSEVLLKVPQVMARYQLGRSAVYNLLRTLQLASITLGHARRIPSLSFIVIKELLGTALNPTDPPDDPPSAAVVR
ncbi:hypothetical protein ACF1GW_13700 [Streptomyces achromogenes]|uniref:hypothetical protein n=1 Tax=Streptomyces achromogenes TaxID=67255 RepID=UPI003702BC31